MSAPTPTGAGIAARLRDAAEYPWIGLSEDNNWRRDAGAMMTEAAAHIEAQAAEIERLRAAVDDARREEVAAMREAVEAIGSECGGREYQAGIRWAQARMTHALEQLEAAIP